MNFSTDLLDIPPDIVGMLDNWRAAALSQDVDAIVEFCAVPMAVYINDDIVVHATLREVADVVAEMLEQFEAAGLRDVRWRVIDCSRRKRKRQTIMVEWQVEKDKPEDSFTFVERYMLKIAEDTQQITMSMLEHINEGQTLIDAYH